LTKLGCTTISSFAACPMVFDQIEQLKRQYTDQYVVVDERRPELARFRGATGQVKTVNMNGRALVQFEDYIANIGWYDIDLEFLKVVPKPDPAAVAPAAKPARAAPAKPSEGEAAAKAKSAAKAPAAKAPAAKAPAAKAAAPAKPAATGGKMDTAAILAAARAKKGAESATAPAESATESAEAEVVAKAAPVAAVKPAPKAAIKAPASGKSSSEKPTTTADIIAFCRRIDSKA
jgi:hypothetical protein